MSYPTDLGVFDLTGLQAVLMLLGALLLLGVVSVAVGVIVELWVTID
jgi:hypothetical protein